MSRAAAAVRRARLAALNRGETECQWEGALGRPGAGAVGVIRLAAQQELGYAPGGVVGLLLVVVLIMLVTGNLDAVRLSADVIFGAVGDLKRGQSQAMGFLALSASLAMAAQGWISDAWGPRAAAVTVPCGGTALRNLLRWNLPGCARRQPRIQNQTQHDAGTSANDPLRRPGGELFRL